MLRWRLGVFCFECFADAVAFLADAVVAVASAKCVHDGVEVLGVPRRAKHSIGVLVAVVAVAVAAVLAVLSQIKFPQSHFGGAEKICGQNRRPTAPSPRRPEMGKPSTLRR
jgi:hypothetical protein